MTQIIVTIDDSTPISLIKKAIGLLKGVKKVVVKTNTDVVDHDNQELQDVPGEIRSLIGIAANIDPDNIANDDRLSSILSK